MQQHLVRVDSARDYASFEESMRLATLSCADASDDWVMALSEDERALHGARFYAVDAPSPETLREAVERARRMTAWSDGPPVFAVLRSREVPSYPAKQHPGSV